MVLLRDNFDIQVNGFEDDDATKGMMVFLNPGDDDDALSTLIPRAFTRFAAVIYSL